jgi:hypothetical protein
MEQFPEQVLAIVAEGASYLAEKECQASELLRSLRSLGAEKVLALYHSKHKRRNYDQIKPYHQLINYFYVISPENQQLLANRVIELVSYIYEYFQACKTYQNTPRIEEVSTLTRHYTQQGKQEAQQFLSWLNQRFKKNMETALQQIEYSDKKPLDWSTRVDASEMQIKPQSEDD